jgi:hypothetical protein
MTRAQYRYVYAILPAGARFPAGLTGLAGRAVEPVRYQSLMAATSAVEPGEVQPRAEDVMAHETTVEALQQAGPLLPVRFGTVLPGTADVERALAEQYAILTADLERLGSTIELGLTVLWDEVPADAGPPPDAESPSAGPGTRYLQARVAEHRRETAARDRAGALADSLDAALLPYALDHRRTTYADGRIAVRAAYLLPANRVYAFQSAFEQSRQQLLGVRCLLSGPWPPYSFVTPAKGRTAMSGKTDDGAMRAPADVPG